MRAEGLEPTRISPQAPKTCASANSATPAPLRIISSGCGRKQVPSAGGCPRTQLGVQRSYGGLIKWAYWPACVFLLLAHSFMDLDKFFRCLVDIGRRVGELRVIREEPITFVTLAALWFPFSI